MARKINTINYSNRLDNDLKLFIKKLQENSDHHTANDITKIRNSYARTCDLFKSEHPPGIKIETTSVTSKSKEINVRIYKKNSNLKAQILYAHGGGFIMGGLESHDGICADICDLTGFKVTAVDYRLSPEYPHPAAFEDVLEIYKSLNREIPVIGVGDSAGGTLIAMLANELKNTASSLKGQVLIYPYLGGSMDSGSYLTHAEAPCLTTNDMKFYLECWNHNQDDSVKIPLNEINFEGLPPTVVFTASDDPLNSDGISYVKKINSSNGKAIHIEGEHLVHGFLRARNIVEKAKISFAKITQSINILSQNEWISKQTWRSL
jgi:acetyl esterase